MKLLKKLFVITLAISMVMGMGAVSAYADTTEPSVEGSTVREVVFYEDFEGSDMVVDERPEKVGGVSQSWGYVESNGSQYYGASIVSDTENNTKVLQLGNNGMVAANTMSEFISFGDTYDSGKYEFSYKVRMLSDYASATTFMSLANSSGRATWESILGVAKCFFLFHNGVVGSPAAKGVSGVSYQEAGFTDNSGNLTTNYVPVKITADFDEETYTTSVNGIYNSGSLNQSSVSGFKSEFTLRSDLTGTFGNVNRAIYYIDEIKVTKIYDLIDELPIKNGAVFKGSYTLSNLNLQKEGVEYKYTYTKDGKTIYPFENSDTATLGNGDYTLKVTAQKTDKAGNKLTATKEVSFKVVKDFPYSDDEYEIVFSEDFDSMTAGATPSTIGGASQSLSSLTKIVYDEENKTYALDMTKGGSDGDRNEYINLGKTYNSGFYTFGYKYRPKNDVAWASYFMRLANSSGSAGTSEALIGTNFYFSHTASASQLGLIIGGPYTGDNEKYVDVSTKVDFSQNKYEVTVAKPDDGRYITEYLNLGIDNVEKLMTRFEASNPHGGAGDISKTAEYYIDDIYVKEHYCLAVGLPFKTGEKYAAGIKLPEIALADDVEHYETYTKDGETVELSSGEALEAGEYTLKVVAVTDGYEQEERIVKFTVVSDGLTVSNSQIFVDDEAKESFNNGDNVKAKIKISTVEGFGDFNIIAVMRDKADDSIKNIFVKSNSELDKNGTADFDFTIPDTGDYELEYFIWENVNSLKAITPKGIFGESSGAD